MKVLCFEHRHLTCTLYMDISTPEKEAAAFRHLFNLLTDEWHVYDNLEYAIDEAEKRILAIGELKRKMLVNGVPELLKPNADFHIAELKNREVALSEAREHFELWRKAHAGDQTAMRTLLELRRNIEGEEWTVIDVDDPVDLLREYDAR